MKERQLSKIEDLKYVLEGRHITPEPREIRLGRRDLGRMIVVDREKKQQLDSYVLNLPDFFESGDVLVLNQSKRVPGIIKGSIDIEGSPRVELQFVSLSQGNNGTLCRIYPDHSIEKGSKICIGSNKLLVIGRETDYKRIYRVEAINASLTEILKDEGVAINAFFSSKAWDVSYFNTFFAAEEGSIESPLAGLHFTPELISKLKDKGVEVTYVTLHSVGSWLPFIEENIDDHVVFSEEFEVPEETAKIINRAKKDGKNIVACGSTSMRTIESSVDSKGKVIAQRNITSLYIKPGYEFKIVDRYFTNFHQYRTSLMVLDAAFCGYDLLMQSIEVAKERGYLFYEYGDAVFYI